MPGDEYGYSFTNPYDDFMRKHLSHYGYYTDRNKHYRTNGNLFNEFNRTHGYQLDSSSTEDNNSASEDISQEKLRSNQLVLSLESGKVVPKLKEPRGLFPASNPAAGPQQAARWPAEIEVIEGTIKHIQNVPAQNEPFYKRTGQESTPVLRSLETGQVVFQLQNRVCPFFVHSRVGGCRSEPSQACVTLQGPDDDTLIFESRFESGNLDKAYKVGPYDYELWLSNDLYTNKHTQWFYFRVHNTRKNVKYRFTICNLMKSNSLYNDGMKPCVYSEADAEQLRLGWRRMGCDITYYKSNYCYASGRGEKPYYALTFTITFQHDRDTCYLAHCYPYTYSDLQDYLRDVVEDERKSRLCRLRVLSRSLAGNLVYLLTITSPYDESQPNLNAAKKAVVLSARVHPGETNSSWMMKGFLDFLLSDAPDAKLLRDTFVFKIVPMLNPDGVIVGNYRCSLAGRDLNRNYKSKLVDSYPTIMSAKDMMKRLVMEREVILYCDLHGHSRKQNVFIYGCENRGNPKKRLHERVFPAMLAKNAPDKFLFEECHFKVQKNKEGCGRIVMWNMGITNSFTMEATFCGTLTGKKQNCHFSTKDFELMGYHFCDTILDYCDPDQTKVDYILSELKNVLKTQILSQFARIGRSSVVLNGKTIDLNDPNLNVEELLAVAEMSEDDGGSDSSVSDGLPVQLEFMQKKSARKKKMSKKDRDRLLKQPQETQPTLSAERISSARSRELSMASRASSAKSRHENCHHNHGPEKPTRKCLSAHRSRHVESSRINSRFAPNNGEEHPLCISGAGFRPSTEEDELVDDEEDQILSESQRAYLKAITDELIKNGDQSTEHRSGRSSSLTGRLRYSSNPNQSLVMNMSRLADQSDHSFSAQYLLDRARDATQPASRTNSSQNKRKTNPEAKLLVQFYTHQKDFAQEQTTQPSRIHHGTASRTQRNSTDRTNSRSSSREVKPVPRATEYSSHIDVRSGDDRDTTSLWSFRQTSSRGPRTQQNYSLHPAAREVRNPAAREQQLTNPHPAVSGMQHPLPFDPPTSKPSSAVASKLFMFGQGSAAEMRPASKPPVPKTRSPSSVPPHSANGSSLRVTGSHKVHLGAEVETYGGMTTSVPATQLNSQRSLPAISRGKFPSNKYLEKMVAETDRDIERLRAEIHEMQTDGKLQAVQPNGEYAILQMASRQRRIHASSQRAADHNPKNPTSAVSRTASSPSPKDVVHQVNQTPEMSSAERQAPKSVQNQDQVHQLQTPHVTQSQIGTTNQTQSACAQPTSSRHPSLSESNLPSLEHNQHSSNVPKNVNPHQPQPQHQPNEATRRGFTGGANSKTGRSNLTINQAKRGLFYQPDANNNRELLSSVYQSSTVAASHHKVVQTTSHSDGHSVPRVSVHMTSHPFPSAPKVNRRVQVRIVQTPRSQRDRKH